MIQFSADRGSRYLEISANDDDYPLIGVPSAFLFHFNLDVIENGFKVR